MRIFAAMTLALAAIAACPESAEARLITQVAEGIVTDDVGAAVWPYSTYEFRPGDRFRVRLQFDDEDVELYDPGSSSTTYETNARFQVTTDRGYRSKPLHIRGWIDQGGGIGTTWQFFGSSDDIQLYAPSLHPTQTLLFGLANHHVNGQPGDVGFFGTIDTVETFVAPEPATAAMALAGLAVLAMARVRKGRRSGRPARGHQG